MPKISNDSKEKIIDDQAEQVIERMILDKAPPNAPFFPFIHLPDEIEIDGKKFDKQGLKEHIIYKLKNEIGCQEQIRKMISELEQSFPDQPLTRQNALGPKDFKKIQNMPICRDRVWMQQAWQQRVLEEFAVPGRIRPSNS